MAALKFLQILFLLSPLIGLARELPEFYRGVRATALGGAFTALSDDADAVFYNPAGLALQDRFEVRLVNPKLDITTDDLTIVGNMRSASKKLDSQSVSEFFGKHIYGNVSGFPALHFPYFTIGYYANAQAGILARNLSLPTVEAYYYFDRGIVGGFGYEWKGLARHHFLRIGTSVKYLTREAFDREITLTELVVADSSYFTDLIAGPATGISLGLGTQYEMPLTKSQNVILGVAWQDIGDTNFGSRAATNKPPSIEDNLSVGAAWIFHFARLSHPDASNFKLSMDWRHLTQSNIDPRLRMHFGAELDLGDLSIQGGINQSNLTAGAKLDLWFLEVSAVTYGVDTQSMAGLDREHRYMAQVTLKLDLLGKKSNSMRGVERKKYPR